MVASGSIARHLHLYLGLLSAIMMVHEQPMIHWTARVCIALRYRLDRCCTNGCMINGVSVLCVRLLANPRILRFCYTATEKTVTIENITYQSLENTGKCIP